MKAAFCAAPVHFSPPTPSVPAVTRRIFLPKEHGSWSLALEPIVFGLLVAPSLAGGALALSATAAFFMRRPMKSFLRNNDRDSGMALAILVSCALVGFAETLHLGSVTALWPLLPALPLGALYLYWDRQNEGRATAAELTGSAVFSLLPAAMASLAGHTPSFAIGLSVLMLARSLPAVLTVRTWLHRRKGQPAHNAAAITATFAGLAVAAVLVHADHIPVLAIGLLIFAGMRLILLSPWRPAWSAKRVGMIEAVTGIIYISTLAIAYHL